MGGFHFFLTVYFLLSILQLGNNSSLSSNLCLYKDLCGIVAQELLSEKDGDFKSNERNSSKEEQKDWGLLRCGSLGAASSHNLKLSFPDRLRQQAAHLKKHGSPTELVRMLVKRAMMNDFKRSLLNDFKRSSRGDFDRALSRESIIVSRNLVKQGVQKASNTALQSKMKRAMLNDFKRVSPQFINPPRLSNRKPNQWTESSALN